MGFFFFVAINTIDVKIYLHFFFISSQFFNVKCNFYKSFLEVNGVCDIHVECLPIFSALLFKISSIQRCDFFLPHS